MTSGCFEDVLIVIPCLNEEQHIGGLLQNLVENTPGALIVVADGGSHDQSVHIAQVWAAKSSAVRLIHNPNRIQSAAVNLAVQLFSDGRAWLVRVDAHCAYPDKYVCNLVDAATKTGATCVVVAMETRDEGGCFQAAIAAAQNSWMGTGGAAHRTIGRSRWVDHGHHALFDLKFFRQVGGYDESFSHNEDAELDLRLAKAGARIWLETGRPIIYHPRKTPQALFHQYANYAAGRARTVLKHGSRLKPRQLAPLAVAPVAVLALAGVWAPVFAAPALGWIVACLAYGGALSLRQRRPCLMASGVAAIIMHFGWSVGFWRELLGGVWRSRVGPIRRGAENMWQR